MKKTLLTIFILALIVAGYFIIAYKNKSASNQYNRVSQGQPDKRLYDFLLSPDKCAEMINGDSNLIAGVFFDHNFSDKKNGDFDIYYISDRRDYTHPLKPQEYDTIYVSERPPYNLVYIFEDGDRFNAFFEFINENGGQKMTYSDGSGYYKAFSYKNCIFARFNFRKDSHGYVAELRQPQSSELTIRNDTVFVKRIIAKDSLKKSHIKQAAKSGDELFRQYK